MMEDAEKRYVLDSLKSYGLYDDSRVGNPVDDIGTSIRLANRIGIEFYGGLCFSTVKAAYPREKCLVEPESMILLGAELWKSHVWFEKADIKEAICTLAMYLCNNDLIGWKGLKE